MSELETRLRQLLQETVPPEVDPAAMVEGARRYAVRARRVRLLVAAATLAVLLGVTGALTSGALGVHALTPADPVDQLTCMHSAQAAPQRPLASNGSLSARFKEVLVCADQSKATVWRGEPPSSEAITLPDSIDYLIFQPGPSQACPALPAGPSYRMLLLDQSGRVTYYDNRSLACNGWTALDRYWIALGSQLEAERETRMPDPFPQCPSILNDQPVKAHSGAPAALPKGVVFTAATSCIYPLADPTRTPDPQLTVDRHTLFNAQLAALNDQARRSGSHKGPVPCRRDPAQMRVLHAVTTTGRQVTLTWDCLDTGVGWVNWSQDDTVSWDQAALLPLFGS